QRILAMTRGRIKVIVAMVLSAMPDRAGWPSLHHGIRLAKQSTQVSRGEVSHEILDSRFVCVEHLRDGGAAGFGWMGQCFPADLVRSPSAADHDNSVLRAAGGGPVRAERECADRRAVGAVRSVSAAEMHDELRSAQLLSAGDDL